MKVAFQVFWRRKSSLILFGIRYLNRLVLSKSFKAQLKRSFFDDFFPPKTRLTTFFLQVSVSY